MTSKIRKYSEIRYLDTIESRYEYLKLNGVIGEETFGSDRYLNQRFYKSPEWRRIREKVILRDNGCDLGIPGFEISNRIIIHHMNPMLLNDIKTKNLSVLNPEFLICTSDLTHKAIHYGDISLLPQIPKERSPGDTRLW